MTDELPHDDETWSAYPGYECEQVIRRHVGERDEHPAWRNPANESRLGQHLYALWAVGLASAEVSEGMLDLKFATGIDYNLVWRDVEANPTFQQAMTALVQMHLHELRTTRVRRILLQFVKANARERGWFMELLRRLSGATVEP